MKNQEQKKKQSPPPIIHGLKYELNNARCMQTMVHTNPVTGEIKYTRAIFSFSESAKP